MDKEVFNEKDLEHLLELSRLEVSSSERSGLLEDLRKILAYFEELKSLSLNNEKNRAKTSSRNTAREDIGGLSIGKQKGVDAFPEAEKGFLRIPPVFE